MERKIKNKKIDTKIVKNITIRTRQEFGKIDFIEDFFTIVLLDRVFRYFIEEKGFVYNKLTDVNEEGYLEFIVKKTEDDKEPYRWYSLFSSKYNGRKFKICRTHYIEDINGLYSIPNAFNIFKDSFKRYKKELVLIEKTILDTLKVK